MDSIKCIIMSGKALCESIATLPIWVKCIAFILGLLNPIIVFILPIIFLVLIDMHTGIKASQHEFKSKNVVSSRKSREKLLILSPFAIGLLAFFVFELTLKHSGMTFVVLGFDMAFILSKVYCCLFMLNEVISILENLDRQGFDFVKPFIKLLRIKSNQVVKKLEEDNESKE